MKMKPIAGAATLLAALILCGCSGQSSGGSGADASATQASAAAAGAPAAGAPGAPGQAGAPGQGGPSARRHFAQALLSLNLSDAQKTQIREIIKAARAQAKGQDPETRRATMRAAYAKVQTILTPDQRKQFAAKMAELRAAQPVSQAPTP